MSEEPIPITPLDPVAAPTPAGPRHPLLRKLARWLLLWPSCVALVVWQTLAVYYSNLPHWLCILAAPCAAIGGAAILIFIKPRNWRWLACSSLFFVIAIWWLTIPPSNERDWQSDVAVLPWAEVEGDRVVMHNIRNCVYRSDIDYDVHHYDRAFDLSKLRTVDLYVVQWGSPLIAHTMLSFGFEGDQFLCISIETRKEKGEEYSTRKGFFRQYELAYVVADERDVVRLRTDARGEQVSLYRIRCKPETIRKVLLGYLQRVNSLRDRPEWYNAATSNCMTNIRHHAEPYAGDQNWDWRFIANGYLPEVLYERGAVDRTLTYAQLRDRSLINDRAKAAGDAADFSRRIREGLPEAQP